MKRTYDLSELNWSLSGWTPYLWRLERTMEVGASPNAEIPSISARVPGSVQLALREAGLLPDWNVGLNYRECEWVENRHWIFEVRIPDKWVKQGWRYRLNCQGLDYRGWVFVNGEEVGEFEGSHVPHIFDLGRRLHDTDNVIRLVFDTPPRWLGQFGYTSKMTDWKPRFNYTWDWTVRLVQTGIWDRIEIEAADGTEITHLECFADADIDCIRGKLAVRGETAGCEGGRVQVTLYANGKIVRREEMSVSEFAVSGLDWFDLDVKPWWPNLMGDQPLYFVDCRLFDVSGCEMDKVTRRVGFKNVSWRRCEGAPEEAYPNLCVVNGEPVFLQGVNWTPILPNFADVTEDDYRKRLTLYKSLGFNFLRVWGGATLEREIFYDLCDEYGFLVWQEFPMSSSGVDNLPPSDAHSIEQMTKIAKSDIQRRRHHVSLLAWCGGNELQNPSTDSFHGTPVDDSHPMIRRLSEIVSTLDPGRRFFFTSPSGPVFCASQSDFGKGIHWHVHGPWKADGELADWRTYWENDDSMLRTETGAPGASCAELIEEYAGDCDAMPVTGDNPLWRRTSVWWIEIGQFESELGREPLNLKEYVDWSQRRQAEALVVAIKCCKSRFPRCGGFVIWMGHDCFPCTTNTSIVDFKGNPKPAALALRDILRG